MILGTLGHNTSLLVINILYHQAGVHYKTVETHLFSKNVSTPHYTPSSHVRSSHTELLKSRGSHGFPRTPKYNIAFFFLNLWLTRSINIMWNTLFFVKIIILFPAIAGNITNFIYNITQTREKTILYPGHSTVFLDAQPGKQWINLIN